MYARTAADRARTAHILRNDLAAHRPLPDDSELAQAIAVLARPHPRRRLVTDRPGH
jgi:hypothetical protein